MTSCHDAQHDFSGYWEGDLPAARRERLETHWSACEPCRGEYESFAAAMQAVRALPRLDAPEDMTARVMARVRTLEAARPATWWAPGRLFDWAAWRADRSWRPALAAATAVLAVVVGVAVIQQKPWQTSPESPELPAVALDLPAERTAPEPPAETPVPRDGTAKSETPATPPSAVAVSPRVAEESDQMARRETRGQDVSSESLTGAAEPAPAGGSTSSFLDSLLLHGVEVEYALDRIRLRKVPGDSGLTPMPAMPGGPEGKPASLTF